MNIKPQLEDLRLFCVVARNRSFAETAREQGVSKALVSKRIALLESGVQERLFHRTTRNVQMTAQGEIVHQWALRILEDVDLMGEAISRERAAPSGVLRTLQQHRLWSQPLGSRFIRNGSPISAA